MNTTTETGLVPPQYSQQIIGDLPVPRPLFDYACAHDPLWTTGMTLNIPNLTDDVIGGWITEGGALPTDDVAVGTIPVSVLMWAHAVKASFSVIERSSPSFTEFYYRRATAAFYRAVEAKILSAVAANAVASAITATDLKAVVTDIFTMAAEVMTNSQNANPQQFNYANTILAAPDVWAALGSVSFLSAPAFSTGSIDPSGQGNADLAGMRVVPVPALAAGIAYVGDRNSVSAYGGGSAGVRLNAMVVGTAQTELGVYAEYAQNVEYTKGWVKHTFHA